MDMYNLWSTADRIVHGESCMFAGQRHADLLFPAEKILRVYQPQENRTYCEGNDYTWQPGTNRIVLTDNSAIPALTAKELSPDPDKAILYPEPGNNAITGGPNGSLVIFDNADFFARHQVEVDYVAAKIDFPDTAADQSRKLPRLRRKLAAGEPIEIVHLGDSISDGFNASRFVGIPPYKPTWSQEFVERLQAKCASRVQYRNFAINGSTCLSAIDNRELWMNRPADLLIIAYGMNDLGLGTDTFINAHKLLINLARMTNPQVEILLVATMAANPLWDCVDANKLLEQHNAIMALADSCGDDTAIADVYSVWQECVRRKGYYSMTGNGVNHPNDFGHRLYTAVLEKII